MKLSIILFFTLFHVYSANAETYFSNEVEVPCTDKSFFNSDLDKWQLSDTDDRSCNPNLFEQPKISCPQNQRLARVPKTFFRKNQYGYTNSKSYYDSEDLVRVDELFHTKPGQYVELCIHKNDAFLIELETYNYYDANQVYKYWNIK